MFLATLNMFFSPSVTDTSSCSDWWVVFSLWSKCRINIYIMPFEHALGLCACVLFHYIPYFGAEYTVVSRLNQYQKYVIHSMVTDATLTRYDLDTLHVERWSVRLFGFSTTGVLTYFRFFIMRVWKSMKILSPNIWTSAERSLTVSEHKKLSLLMVFILIDILHATPYYPTS